jgi:hypothetical protein
LSVALGVLGLAQLAHANPTPVVRLRVQSTVAECVDEQNLRDAVAGRLGYQPFQNDAPSSVEVDIARTEGGYAGQVERFDADGRSVGQRRFSSPSCAQLAPAIELALAIAIDPLSLTRPTPAPLPPSVAPPASPALGLALWGGGLGALGIAPTPSGGVTVGGELRWPNFSLGIEGQADLPSSTAVETGSVQVSSLYASVVPCWRFRYLGACGFAAGGAWQINSFNLVNAAHTGAPFAALGVRALGELPVHGIFSLRLCVDLLAPLAHETVDSGNTVIWTTPALAGEAALLLAFRLR